MGSLRFEGVLFSAYSDDHAPPHIHAKYAGMEVVIDLLPAERAIALSNRPRPVRPANGNRADVNYILQLAAEHFDALIRLWEVTRG